MRIVGNELQPMTLQPIIDPADIVAVDHTWYVHGSSKEFPFSTIAEAATDDDTFERFGRFDLSAIRAAYVEPEDIFKQQDQWERHAFLAHALAGRMVKHFTRPELASVVSTAATIVDQAINVDGEKLMVGFAHEGQQGVDHLARLVGFIPRAGEQEPVNGFAPTGLYLPVRDWPYISAER